MCGRFSMHYAEDLKDRYRLSDLPLEIKNRYNITPGQDVLVITKNSPNRASFMRWGLIPYWAKDPAIGFRMINARAETIAVKPSFKRSLLHQRCLVPASGFYEWKKTEDKKKIPYNIKLKKLKLFSMAGLYDVWKDVQGKELTTFTIITVDANKLLMPIHSRMPAILSKNEESVWLDKSVKNENILEKLLKPFDAEKMEVYPVSKKVNSPQNENKDLIKPQDPEEEKEQPSLF